MRESDLCMPKAGGFVAWEGGQEGDPMRGQAAHAS